MKKSITILTVAFSLILTACSDLSSNQDLYPFSENGKWGYINQNGDVVIKPQYEMAEDFVGNYAAVLLDSVLMSSEFSEDGVWHRSHWCIINKKGTIQLKDHGPFYGDISITTDGYAVGCLGHTIGEIECLNLINIKDGKRPFPKLDRDIDYDDIKFTTMEDFQRNGMLAYHDVQEGLWGFLNQDGNFIKPKYASVYGIQNGIASVQDNESGKYYLIDKSGNRTTKQEYESIVFHLGHNLYSVAIGEKYAFINSKGDVIVKPQFDDLVDGFNDNGLIYTKIWVNEELQYAYVDTLGNTIIGPYEELGLWDMQNELIKFGVRDSSGYKEGFIDKNGKVIISPRFAHSCDFSEGLAWAQKTENDKYGYIDKTGEFVIQPAFDYADSFKKCGLAIVKKRELYGVIDKTGKYILDPSYDYLSIYDTGMIAFGKNEQNGYANAQGVIVKTFKE